MNAKARLVGAVCGLCVLLILPSCGSDNVVLGSNDGQSKFSVAGKTNTAWWTPVSGQSWNGEQRLAFWFTPQGSWMVPYDWFVVLEQAHSADRFASDDNIRRLGYIPWKDVANPPAHSDAWNPDHLPIGFTRSPWTTPDDGTHPVSWLGPNCSACHTGHVTGPNHEETIVDGAPSRGDFYQLNYDLAGALVATACDDQKFSRFLGGVNQRIAAETVKGLTPETEEALRLKLRQEITYLAAYIDNNLLGRTDGVTKEINSVLDGRGNCSVKGNFTGIEAYQQKIRNIRALRWQLILRTEAALKQSKDPQFMQGTAWVDVQPNKDLMAIVPSEPGKARVDAVGAIFNEVAAVAIHAPQNIKLANAPVRFPYLWGTPQSAVVQWSGFADNHGLGGPLGRNAGEVLGVEGRINVKSATADSSAGEAASIAVLHEKSPTIGYSSSIVMRNAGQFERWLSALSAPAWPAFLPKIDEAKRARGEAIFNGRATETGVNCASCHESLRDEGKTFYQPVMIQTSTIGTDPMMVDNLALERNPISLAPWSGGDLQNKPEPNRFDVLKGLVGNALLGNLTETVPTVLHTKVYDGAAEDDFDPRSYKGRPLYGVWAVGPYLHNGSVPNLLELLKPDSERMTTFVVGNTTYDPVNVGFVTTACTPGVDDDCYDTTVTGNRNTGHSGDAYGTGLSDSDKAALLEYLKSL